MLMFVTLKSFKDLELEKKMHWVFYRLKLGEYLFFATIFNVRTLCMLKFEMQYTTIFLTLVICRHLEFDMRSS